ncbi:MAG: guanylate kinase [Planctomycetaceae bacterium]|nr:guanylate kinase [Planctomycetaceae bacterium]
MTERKPILRQGRLVIVSGPSGVGKTSVMQRVFDSSELPLVRSVSATTRPPRPGEIDGQDYHFITNDEFQLRRQRGEFLECFQVFDHSCWYGTLWAAVTPGLAAGKWVVLEIDVQGALAVMERFAEAITIFLRPSSREELERRLRGRGTETEQSICRRLAKADRELALADRYRHQVVNDRLDEAVRQICAILTTEWERAQHD